MKKTCLALFFSAVLARDVLADVIAQWNFNSVTPDGVSTTGSTVPSVGTATIAVIGGATQTFSSGNNSTDPATTDDTAYHTLTYPNQGAGNKTRGIQVNVSTLGYESIVVSWDQQNSASASRYFRFQYSLDGTTFIDGDLLTTDVALSFINGRSVNLNSILGAHNNPNFAFRLVTEFEPGTSGYVATSGTATYSGSGTIRYDMLTIAGSPANPNSFPTITAIANQTTRVDTATADLPFQVGDVETPADRLVVTAASSNPGLVAPEGIVFGGSGTDRTVTVGPNFDQIGTATITITVTDEGGKSASTAFVLTVLPNNTAPTISAFRNAHTVMNAAFEPIPFAVADPEQDPGTLTVSVSSSDQGVIPDGNLVVSGTGASRTLTIIPPPGVIGNSVITVAVTDDGALSASRTFNAMVLSSNRILLSEPFNYEDGALTTGSGRLWTTRAGTPNQMQMTGGKVQVTSSQTEDVLASLIGSPYNTSGSATLYASFDVTFVGLPAVAPDIFAHFSGVDSANLRGRVLASTANAASGFYHLGVANTTSSQSNVVDYPLDLSLDTSYQVVVAYDVAGGSTELWVNPASGGAPVDAIDPRLPTPIASYGLRQSGGIGDMRIDNLLVGLSFEDVTPNLTRVHIRRARTAVEVYWPSGGIWSGFVLESTRSLQNPDWQPVNQATVPIDGWDVMTIENPAGNEFFRLRNALIGGFAQ